MESRFLRFRLLIILLVLVAFMFGAQQSAYAKNYNINFDGACVGGVVNSTQLLSTNPSVPSGLRDKGSWVNTGGLDFSNTSHLAVITGFSGPGPYTAEFRLHNGDRYFYTITAPVTAATFTFESNGSTDPVLLGAGNYPVPFNVTLPDGTSYAYYFRNVQTGVVNNGPLTSPSSNWSFSPADDQPVYSAYSVVTHNVSGRVCRSVTNSIEVSKNITLQVIGGGSVCQATGTFVLEVVPYAPGYDYVWSLPGGGTSTGSTYSVDLDDLNDRGDYVVRAYENPGGALVATSDPVTVGAYNLTASINPGGLVPLCDGVTTDIDGTSVHPDPTINLDYQWIRNGVAEAMTSNGSTVNNTRVVSDGGEFVFKVQESTNPLCYALSAPTNVELTIEANQMPVSGSSVCVGNSLNNIQLLDSEVGVTYRLMHDDGSVKVMVQEWMSEADLQPHLFDPETSIGTYTVEATGCTGIVPMNMAGGPYIISALPNLSLDVNLIGSGCEGTNHSISVLASEVGVRYQLFNGASPASLNVNGGGDITFPGISDPGTYRVRAERNGCADFLTETVYIGEMPASKGFSPTVGCANTPFSLTLLDSEVGVLYTIVNAANVVRYSIFSNTGGDLNFNITEPVGEYTIWAENADGCRLEIGKFDLLDPPNTTYDLETDDNPACASNGPHTIRLDGSQAGFTYRLFRGATQVFSAVSPANGVLGLGQHSIAGIYTVTVDNGGCLLNIPTSLEIVPTAANIPVTSNSFCEGEPVIVSLPASQNGAIYRLYRDGTLYASEVEVIGNGDPIVFGPESFPEGTYRISASMSPFGCDRLMSGSVVVNENPDVEINPFSDHYCANAGVVTIGGRPQIGDTDWSIQGQATNPSWFTESGSTATIDVTDLINTSVGASDRVTFTFNYWYRDIVTGCEAMASEAITFVDDLSDDLNFTWREGADPFADFAGDLELCQTGNVIDLRAVEDASGNPIVTGRFSTDAPAGSIVNTGTGDDGTATFNPTIAGNGRWEVIYTYIDPASGCEGSVSHFVQIGTTLSLHDLNAIYCAANTVDQEWYGTPTGGTITVERTDDGAIESQDLLLATDRYIFNPNAKGPGTYEVTYSYTFNGCTSEITETIEVTDVMDATFDTDDGRRLYCVTNPPVPFDPAPLAGSFYSGTGVGLGTFDPAAAGVGVHTITHTIQDGFCSETETITITVVEPDVAVVLSKNEFCHNETDLFSVEAGDMPIVGGFYSRDQADKTIQYTFSTNAVDALFYFDTDGTTRIYGDSFQVEDGDEPIYFDPNRVPAVGGSDVTINIYLEYTAPVAEGGCEVYTVQPILVKSVQAVNFGTTEPMEFCQNSTPIIMEGRYSGSGAAIGSGYFSADFPMDNLVDGAGTGNNGRALFDPSLVTPTNAYEITYHYENPNGCISSRTKSFKILAAPIMQRVTPVDPNGGIYCEGDDVTIGLQGTQVGVRYYLQKDGLDVNPAVQFFDGAAPGNTPRNFPVPVTAPGLYTVRAEMSPLGAGCKTQMDGSVVVAEKVVVGVLESLTHETCAGSDDGRLEFSAYGGVAPYTYTLMQGATTVNTSASGEFSGIEPGVYSVIIEDAVGCDWTMDPVEITARPSIAVTDEDKIDVVCYGQSNGAFAVRATGLASGNYEFQLSGSSAWLSNGTGRYVFTNLPAGTYDVTVRDADNPGCLEVMPTVTIVEPPAAVSLTVAQVSTIGCSLGADGAITAEAAGGDEASGFNYVLYREVSPGFWVNVDASTAPVALGTPHPFSNLFAGNYRVVASDSEGCSFTAEYTVDGPTSLPTITLSGDEIVHVSQPGGNDGIIEIAVSGGDEPYIYEWREVDAIDGDTLRSLTPGLTRQTGLSAGFYRAIVTDNNGVGCMDSLDVELFDDPLIEYKLNFGTTDPGPCYGSSNGEISIGVVGGLAPYQSLILTNGAGQLMIPTTSGNSFANYENLPAGNYLAVVRDARGISLSELIELDQPLTPMAISLTTTDATCFEESGNLVFSVTGGTPFAGTAPALDYYNFTILPSSGIAISGKIEVGEILDVQADLLPVDQLPAGDYQLTITDAVTCFDVVNFTISEPNAMSIVVEDRQHNLCHGASDGSITVSVDGRPGGTAFDFEWQSWVYDVGTSTWNWTTLAGETSASINNLPAGTYQVKATETASSSCESEFSGPITIGQPAVAMIVSAIPTHITTCHGDNTGSVRLSVTGGTAPYTIEYGTEVISWNGLNDYVVSGLLIGTYNFTITDDQGCAEGIPNVTITEPDPFVVSNFDYGIECDVLSSGYVAFDISGGLQVAGTNSYHALLVRNDNNQVYHNGPVGAINAPLINTLIAGTYTIRITDANSSDPSACLFEQQFELRNISVTANVIDPTCSGQDNGSIELTVTGGSGGYSFNWVDDGSTNPNRYGLAPGNYEVIIGDSKEGCSFTRDWTIDYQNTLSVNEVVSDVTCHDGSNGSITATANGGVEPYNYLWEKYNGTDYVPLVNTQTISSQTIGIYKVTVTDFNGCQISKEDIEIEQPDDFTIDSHMINNHVDCYGGANGSFTVVPDPLAGNFEYSIDGINWQVSPIFTNLVAGGYQVAMRDRDRPGPDYCAKYDVEDVIITQPEALAVNLDEITNVSCFNGNDGAIEVTADGGTVAGSYTYQWYRVTGTGNTALTLGSVNPATTLTAGDYRVRVTDDNLCSIWSDVYTVTEPASTPAITVVANNSVTTPGGNDGSITISIAGGTPGYSISWTGPAGYTASGAASIFNLLEGTYTASVLDSKGCPVTRDITVSEPGTALQLSVLSAINPVLCPVAQSGSIELEATGGTQPYTFTLTKRVGMVVTTGIVSANYITYSGLDAGIYDARLVDDNGVVIEVTGITLEVPDALDLSIVNISDAVCFGESNGEISFTAEGGTPSDNGTAGDPTDDYHTYVIVSEAGLPSYSGQIIDGDTELISSLPAGNYSLTVTDSNGCSVTSDFSVSQPDDLSVSVENITQVTCNGGNNGAISTIVNGRPGGTLFTYSWEFSTDQLAWNPYAGTSLSINGLGAGWYRVTALETATNCSVTSSDIRINQPAAVSLAVDQVNDITTCHGDDSGSIVLSVNGGTAPYMVKYGTVEEPWSGLNNYVAAGLIAGDYTFEITDALGCTSIPVTRTILEPDLFEVSLTSGIGCDIVNTGWIDLDISGGLQLAGDYNYQVRVIRKDNNQVVHNQPYTNPAIPVEILGLAQGDYLVYAWDTNSADAIGCRKQFDVSLRNMLVSANVIHPTCDGQDNGSLEAVVTGGSGDYSITWTMPDASVVIGYMIDDLEPGTYVLTVRDNVNGCDVILDPIVIDYAFTLAVDTDTTGVSCFGGNDGSATAIPSGGTEPYFYLWERLDGATWSPLANTATLSNRTVGTYRVTVTDVNNCQATSADVVIGGPADFNVASITYNQETVSCFGGADGSFEVQVSGGSGNFEYSIDAVNWQILPTFDNLAAGSYRISIRDMDQPAPYCPKYEVATATILEANPVVIALDNQVNVDCFGDDSGALTISATGGTAPYSYQWFVVTGTGNIPLAGETNAVVTDLVAGNYFVQVWDNNLCLTTSEVYTLTQPATQLVVSEFSNQPVSANDGNDGSITVAITGGTPGYSIAWTGVDYDGNNVTASLAQNVVTLNNLKAGVYTATVTDGKLCTDAISITVSQPGDALTLSEILVNPQPCNGATNGSIELTAAGGALPYTFTLIRNPGTEMPVSSVSGNKATFNGLSAGFYTARVQDANGNVVELSGLELTQPDPVEIYYFAPTNITCFNEADGSINFSIRGGTPDATNGYSYILRPENGTDIIGSGDINISVAGLNPVNYTLRVFDASNVCFAERSYTLTQPAEIVLTETITPVSCNGLSDGSIRIEVSGGIGGGYTYEWFVYNTVTTNFDAIAASNTAWLQNRGAGRYKVEVTELGGATCSKESAEFNITEPAVLTASATPFDVNTCPGDNSGRITVVVNGGVAPYVVDYGTGTQYGNGPEFFIEDLVADFYTVVVTDNNGSGCQTVATATVGEPAEGLSVTAPVVAYSCVLPSAETHSVSFEINGGVGVFNAPNNEFSYHIEVVNLVTSGRKTKTIAATIDQPVLVNLDDLNLGLGDYRLIVTDAHAAASTSCAAVEHDFTISRISVSEIISPVSCSGAADGAIDITVTGGSGNYTYAWAWVRDGIPMTASSQDLSGLSAGNYNLTITDVGQPGRCPVTRTYTVGNAKTLVVQESVAPVKCFGGNDGAIRITGVANAAPGLSYFWNGSAVAGSNELSGLAAGDYSVEIIDGDGCSVTKTFTVIQPNAALSVALSSTLACLTDTRSITAVETGGTGPFTSTSFAWSGPGTFTRSADGRTISGITVGGEYTVQVTDAYGCSVAASIVIDGAINLSADVTSIDCNTGTGGNILLNVNGGSGNYSYLWTKDALPFAQTTKDIVNLGAGIYAVTVTDNLQDCDAATKYSVTLNDIVVSQPSAIQMDGNVTNNECYGGAEGRINLHTVTGGTAPYSFIWTTTDGSGLTAGARNQSGLTEGTYTVQVRDDRGCLSATESFTVTELPELEFDADFVDTNCANNNSIHIINAAGGSGLAANYEFIWDGPGVDASTPLIQTDLPGGTYTITMVDMGTSARCFLTQTVELTQHLNVSAAVQPESCSGSNNGVITLDVTGGAAPYSFTWVAAPGIVVNDRNQAALPAGTYNVTVTDSRAGGGCSLPLEVVVPLQHNMQLQAAIDHVECFGGSNGAIYVTVLNGSGDYTYQWTKGAFSATIEDIENLEAGEYTLQVTDNVFGCTVTGVYTVTQPPVPMAISVVDVNHNDCFGDTNGAIDINVTGGTGTYTYQWTGPGNLSFPNNEDQADLRGGDYYVSVTDASGCLISNYGPITVNEPATPVTISLVDVTPVTALNADDGTITVQISGGTGSYTSITWLDPADVVIPALEGSTFADDLPGGTYTIQAMDANSCPSEELEVYVYEPGHALELDIEKQASGPCFGSANGKIFVTVKGGELPYQSLSLSDGTGTLEQLTEVNSAIFDNLAPGDYTVTIIDAFGNNVSENVRINEATAPLAVTATVATQVDCRGSATGVITARVTGGIPNASNQYRLLLSGGPAGTSTEALVLANADHTFINLPKGTYTVRVIDDSNVLRVAHGENDLQDLFGNNAFSLTNDCSATVEDLIVRQPEAVVHLSVEPGSEEVCAGVAPRLVAATSGWDFVVGGALEVILSNGDDFVLTAASEVLILTTLPVNTLTSYTIVSVTSATVAACEKGEGAGQATVVRHERPTASLSGTTTVCAGETASLNLQLTGTAPWQVSYSDGTSTYWINDIATPTYQLAVSPTANATYTLASVADAHCSGTVAGTAAVTVPVVSEVSFVGDSSRDICVGDNETLGVEFDPADNGPWQLTYSAQPLVNGLPSGAPALQTLTVNATMLVAGVYEFSVTPSQTVRYRLESVVSGGCPGTVTGLPIDVLVGEVPAQPGAIVGDNVVCQGQSVTYTIPEIPNVTTYVWTHPDGTEENSTNSLTIDYATDAVGGRLYVFAKNACGDGPVQYMDITVNNLPDTAGIAIIGTANICQGAKRVSFMVPAVPYATTYKWTVPDDWDFDGQDGRQILLDVPDEIMNYSGVISVTPENSCGEAVAPITFNIYVRPNPSANAGPDVPDHCENFVVLNATAVNAAAGETGQWLNPPIYGSADPITDVNNPNVMVSGLSQGDVTFLWMVTSAQGCVSYDDVTIRNNKLPVNATADNTNVCNGSTTLRGTSLNLTGQWTAVAPIGSTASFDDASSPNAVVSNMPVGENRFRWTLNQNGCPSWAEVTVMNRQADAAVIHGPVVVPTCGEEVTLTAEAPRTGWGTGQWSLLSGYAEIVSPNSTSTVVRNISQGNVVVLWTVTNGQCSNTASVTIRNDVLTVDAGPEQDICSASTILEGSPVPTGATGSWHVISGSASFADGNSPTTTVTNLARGETELEWRMTNNGCESSDEVLITNNMATVATVGSAQNACDLVPTLSGNPADTGDGEVGYWSVVSGGGSFVDANDPGTMVNGMDFGPNIYRWTINNKNKCSSSADLTIINLKTFVDAGKDTVVCDNVVTLRGNPVPPGMTGSWHVVPDEGSALLWTHDPTKPHIVLATGLGQGPNRLIWRITNNGCASDDDLIIDNSRPYPVNGGSSYQEVSTDKVAMGATEVQAGIGEWILVSGGGHIEDPTNPNTNVTSLRRGENVFWWVVTNGNCSEYREVIIVNGDVVEANAGGPQTLCSPSTSMEANDAEGAIGSWSVISGTANFEDRYDPRTKVNNLSPGENILRWTISYGSSNSSSSSFSDVVITNNRPAEASAGNDVTFCNDEYQLRGNTPATVPENMGTPLWTIISGGGDLDVPGDPNTMVTNLAKGLNELVYSITKGDCVLRDTVQIINGLPSVPEAGDDVAICTDSYLLNPNTPTHGTAGWRPGSTGGARFEGNTVYDLAQGPNELIYEISTEWGCPQTDTVTITNNKPSASYAGQTRDLCEDTYQLRAEEPLYGTGTWQLVAGAGVIDPAEINNANATVTGLASGSNRFRWTVDNNGCTSTSEVEIRYNFIEANAGEVQVICENFTELRGSNPMQGTGTWGIEGGSGIAVFEDPYDPLTRVTNLDRGENVLTWTVTNRNCSDVSTVSIINNKPTMPNAGDDQALCDPSTVLQGNVDVVGQGRWTVRSGSATFSSATHADAQTDPSANISGLTFGPNILRWTIVNEGCTLYDDVVMTYNRIDAHAGNDREVCADQIVLSAQSPLPGSGTWSVPGGQGAAVFESPTSPTTRVTNLGRGTNTLRWTVWHNGCSTHDDMVVVNQLPSTPYAGNEQIICSDFTTLDATAPTLGSTGYWQVLTGSAEFENGDQTVHNALVTNLAEGDNIFVWTTQKVDGCTLEDQVLIRNNEPSDPYAGANYEEVCSSTFTLKASTLDYGTGIWSFVQGGGNLSDPNNPKATITTLGRGTNVLRWTVSQGNCSKFSEITIVNNTPTTANAGPDIEDCKDVQALDANVPVYYENAYWERISGYGELDDMNDPKTTVRNLAFGPNEFQWVIEMGACTSTDRVVIFNKIPDKAFAGSDQLNVCDTYTVLNANDPETGTGQWSVIKGKGSFDDATQYNTIVRNLGFGENIYRWEVAYGECSTVDEVAIVSHKTEAYAGEDQVVYEPQAVLNANNAGELDAHWLIVGTSTATFADATFFNTAVYNLSEGINTFGWEINVNGCISYDQVSVDYRPVPDAGFITNVDEGCYPLRVQFTNYSVGGSVYQWSFGDGSTSADRNPVHMYTQPGSYTVQLNAPGPDGMDGVFTKEILVYDHPVADFTVNPTVVYVPGEKARFYDLSTDAVSWYWDFGDGVVSTDRNPSHEYSDEGVYDVMLTVGNTFECKDTLIVENAVVAEPQGFVVFPNAFKPRPGNASGQVDPSAEYVVVFKPAYRDVDAFTLEIFNRWGQKIFETNDIDNGWDGMYEGQMAPQAVYIYKATGKYYNGREFRKSGSVLLVR